MATVTLTAVYDSPSDRHTLTIDTAAATATEASSQREQTAHVAALRENIGTLQDQVNAYLTARMEAEKRTEEEVEEEEYGEEEEVEEE
ncbi:hypothetical protein FN846DRAFT_970965 [Sphaerosporella brunnea]|uniref:EKC/KEOPS complex subunit GON7 n=1 Tax=Sphaerosporella brunnea TaxID=1250544 RepID=A0A5J5EJD9_9PEZI|nr:hypothetical protein FN846DRAFT_970965 [Sphaerosporella brunnea]